MNYRGPQAVISAPGRHRALRWRRSVVTPCEGCNRSIQAAAPITKPAHRRPGSAALPAAPPGIGAGTFCSDVGAAGHRRWRLLPRGRGWRAPAAMLPGIGGKAFCPDAGAPGHRRRGFLSRGRGWGTPAAMLRAPTARLFAPAAGLAGIDAGAFLPGAQGSRRCAQGAGRCAQGSRPCERTAGAGFRACHACPTVSRATALPGPVCPPSGPGHPSGAQLRPR